MHPRDQQINKIIFSEVWQNAHEIYEATGYYQNSETANESNVGLFISFFIALSQTPSYTARLQIHDRCMHGLFTPQLSPVLSK